MGLHAAGARRVWVGLFGAPMYVALHTSEPAATATEIEGHAYERVAIAPDAWTISGEMASNTAAVNFPMPSSDWPEPTHVGLWSHQSGGDLLVGAALVGRPGAPVTGAEVLFAAHAFEFAIHTDPT